MLMKKTAEIRKALEMGLCNCALALSLTLPDICGKVEYPNIASTKQRYMNWFKKYAKPLFTVDATALPSNKTVSVTWFTENDCYALRCAVLHAGNYRVKGIDFTTIRLHAKIRHIDDSLVCDFLINDGDRANWDVFIICNYLCLAAENYYKNTINKGLFDLNEVQIID